MDDAIGLYAVHAASEEEQVNGCFGKVDTSYPPDTGAECGGEDKHPAIPEASDHY